VKLTVDIVLLTIRERRLHVLLIRRGVKPFEGKYAIPGGFVQEGESLEKAAARELAEETGVADVFLEQLYTFGDPGRDPRGRVVTVAYFALVPEAAEVRGGSDAREAAWFPVEELPALAFDHGRVLDTALARLRGKLDYSNVGFGLLPAKFTLSELQAVHEAILGESLDKRNFRRKVAQRGIVKALKEWRATGRKPAQLFRFVAG
jgi:8-oxo-dGTP diphosphatase